MLDPDTLARPLAAVRRPVAEARGLPSDLYTQAEALDLERRLVFDAGWACIGFGKDVPEPGDARPVDHLGAPLLLLRDQDGALRVHQNVCRHRGMILVETPRNFGGVIRCPYHSWCYSLDGRLRATPHVGGPGINRHDGVDPDRTGLIPVRCAVWMDMVFVNISGTAAPFEDWIAPLARLWSDFAGHSFHHGGPDSSFTLEVACNWKLAVENYCESYHLPWVHPGLNAYSRLEDHYHIEHPGRFSGQGTRVYAPQLAEGAAFPDMPGLPPKWDRAAEYVSLFPNVMLGIHRDHFFAIRLEPLAAGRTREHVEIYYAASDATGPAFAELRARNAALWKTVFEEDIFVVEGMQKGRHAPGFDGGVFSPVMDSPTHLFHDWVASHLAP